MRSFFSVAISLVLMSVGALADTADSAKINRLEAKVQALETTIRSLEAESRQLRLEIADLKKTLGGALPVTCTEREEKLAAKLDQLEKLGWSENHPDILNVKAQLKAVQTECEDSAEPDAPESGLSKLSDCKQALETLKAKLDSLRTLGFTDSHPDIRNINAQVTEISSSCPA